MDPKWPFVPPGAGKHADPEQPDSNFEFNPGSSSTSPTQGYISLGEASRLAPGQPSCNSLWRWARKGVKGRNGERIRLRHIRVGGKILTRPNWVADFGMMLAAADEVYFKAKDHAAGQVPPRDPRYGAPVRGKRKSKQQTRPIEDTSVDAELDEEGL